MDFAEVSTPKKWRVKDVIGSDICHLQPEDFLEFFGDGSGDDSSVAMRTRQGSTEPWATGCSLKEDGSLNGVFYADPTQGFTISFPFARMQSGAVVSFNTRKRGGGGGTWTAEEGG
jgi:hypothetical protein